MTTNNTVLVGIRAVLSRAVLAPGHTVTPTAKQDMFHKAVENLLDGLDLSQPPTQRRGGAVPFPARTSTTRLGFPVDQCVWVCYVVVPFEPGSDVDACLEVLGDAIQSEVDWYNALPEEEKKLNQESYSPSLASFKGLELAPFDKASWMYDVGLVDTPPPGYVPHPNSPEAKQSNQDAAPQGPVVDNAGN